MRLNQQSSLPRLIPSPRNPFTFLSYPIQRSRPNSVALHYVTSTRHTHASYTLRWHNVHSNHTHKRTYICTYWGGRSNNASCEDRTRVPGNIRSLLYWTYTHHLNFNRSVEYSTVRYSTVQSCDVRYWKLWSASFRSVTSWKWKAFNIVSSTYTVARKEEDGSTRDT